MGITHLIIDDLMSYDFPTYRTSNVILGHISLSIKIYRSSWSRMILITYDMYVELMVYCYLIMIPEWSLSPSGVSPRVESLLGHLVRFTLFDIWMLSCFFFWETSFWCLDLIQLWIWMIGITPLMMDDSMLSDFSIYYTSDVIPEHISLLVKVYRSSWICMITPIYKMHVELMIYCYLIMISQWSLF